MGNKNNQVASDAQQQAPQQAEQSFAGTGAVPGVWYTHNVDVAGMPLQNNKDNTSQPDWHIPGAGACTTEKQRKA